MVLRGGISILNSAAAVIGTIGLGASAIANSLASDIACYPQKVREVSAAGRAGRPHVSPRRRPTPCCQLAGSLIGGVGIGLDRHRADFCGLRSTSPKIPAKCGDKPAWQIEAHGPKLPGAATSGMSFHDYRLVWRKGAVAISVQIEAASINVRPATRIAFNSPFLISS